MNFRLLLALLGFMIVVGGPSLWLYLNIVKKKRLLYSLLNQPKKKRFFWYRLRTQGYNVISQNELKELDYTINGQSKSISLKADFLVVKKSKKYVGLFTPVFEEKEYLKQLIAYSFVFRANGVIFYDEIEKKILVLELN